MLYNAKRMNMLQHKGTKQLNVWYKFERGRKTIVEFTL